MKRRRFLTWLVALAGGCGRMPVLAAPSYRYDWRHGGGTDDPSILHLGHSDGHRVYCDGADMGRRVFAARSGPNGWVHQYEVDEKGALILDASGMSPRTKRTTGNVVVSLADDGVLRHETRGKNLGIIEDGTHGIARHGMPNRLVDQRPHHGSFPGRRPGKPHKVLTANQHSPSE